MQSGGKLFSSLRARVRLGFISAMSTSVSSIGSPRQSPSSVLSTCLAVSRRGTVSLDPTQSAPILERPPIAHSRTRTLVLNRQSTLNALNLEMLDTLYSRISALDASQTVDTILLSAAPGRAFCAGGDVRHLYDIGSNGEYDTIAEYFRAEYTLNWLIASLRNTVLISVLDGIVMGGGAGLSVHGRFRIATENTLFAMPECGIALHPDVGMAYVLSRLPGGLGIYLGLTGARLKSADVVSGGIATHFIPSHQLADFSTRLSTANTASAGAVARVIEEFSEPKPQQIAHQAVIDECFGIRGPGNEGQTVENILGRLRVASQRPGPEGKFAEDALAMILKGCPMSVKITLEAIKRCYDMQSVRECLEMDFRLATRSTRRPDFYAGVRSAVVTKDRNPTWDPATLDDVSDESIRKAFEPLSELNVRELQLDPPTELRSNVQDLRHAKI